MGAKPQSSPGSKDLGRSDPEALDELEKVEGKLYQQDSSISIYVDIQFCVKRMYFVRRDSSKRQLWERLVSEAHRVRSILSIRSRFPQTCTVLREVNAIKRQRNAKG